MGKNRLPHRPQTNTLERRFERAWKSLQAGDYKNYGKKMVDMKSAVRYYSSKLDKNPHNKRYIKAVEDWKNHIATVKTARKKKTADKFFGNKSVKDFGYDTKHLFDVVKALKAGETHSVFTLLSAAKAGNNHTVHVVVNIDKEHTLCIYKHAVTDDK